MKEAIAWLAALGVVGCTVGTVDEGAMVEDEGRVAVVKQAQGYWYQCGAPAELRRCTNWRSEINVDGKWYPISAGCRAYCEDKVGKFCDDVRITARRGSLSACSNEEYETSTQIVCKCQFLNYVVDEDSSDDESSEESADCDGNHEDT